MSIVRERVTNREEIAQLLDKVTNARGNEDLFRWVIETYVRICPRSLWSPHYDGSVSEIMKKYPNCEEAREQLQFVLSQSTDYRCNEEEVGLH